MIIEPPFSRAARLFYPDSPGSPICKPICCSICFRSTAFIVQMHFSILSFHEELFYLEFLVQFKSCKTHRTLCLEDLPWFWKLLRYFIINPQVILIPYVSSSLCNVCQYLQPAGWAAEGDSLAFLVGECQRQMEPLVWCVWLVLASTLKPFESRCLDMCSWKKKKKIQQYACWRDVVILCVVSFFHWSIRSSLYYRIFFV